MQGTKIEPESIRFVLRMAAHGSKLPVIYSVNK